MQHRLTYTVSTNIPPAIGLIAEYADNAASPAPTALVGRPECLAHILTTVFCADDVVPTLREDAEGEVVVAVLTGSLWGSLVAALQERGVRRIYAFNPTQAEEVTLRELGFQPPTYGAPRLWGLPDGKRERPPTFPIAAQVLLRMLRTSEPKKAAAEEAALLEAWQGVTGWPERLRTNLLQRAMTMTQTPAGGLSPELYKVYADFARMAYEAGVASVPSK